MHSDAGCGVTQLQETVSGSQPDFSSDLIFASLQRSVIEICKDDTAEAFALLAMSFKC